MAISKIGTNLITDATIITADLADSSITSAKIADGTIATADLADDAITAAKLATNAVVTASIVAGSVDTTELAADAVTGAKVEDDAIDSEHIVDGSIDTAHISDNAVTIGKMADLARGKIIYGDSSGNPAVLAVGSANKILTSDGTDIAWTSNVTGNVSGTAATVTTAAQPAITSVGTLTSFRSTGIDDNADALAITIDSSERVGIGTTAPNRTLTVYGSSNGEMNLKNSSADFLIQQAGHNTSIGNSSSSGYINFFTNNGSSNIRM